MPRPQVYYYSRAAPPLPGGPPPRLARPQTAASASLFVCKAAARRGGEPARVCAALPGRLGAVSASPPFLNPPTPRGPSALRRRQRGCGGRGARAAWPRAHGAASRRFLPSVERRESEQGAGLLSVGLPGLKKGGTGARDY
ncbi:neuronal regeneration-related protein isoform X1 [Peromyscus maniculatus bairdii]|uniref:neuronal regeneration-related protein isoform X1 n=1 Tax=Peromyscus maniculatus bairdii TaxID=230844 RepID=UPI003FD0D300